MAYTLEEKYALIKKEVLKYETKNPLIIFEEIVKNDYINMHGPEHHFLDGACFLVAYNNACGKIDINKALEELEKRTIKMPGAMCGYWGVCGSVTALGASLSIIHNVSPISKIDYYKDDMEFTSSVIKKMSLIGGPRCCKRNAYLSITSAIDYVKDKYGIIMEKMDITCKHSNRNADCLKENCPFHKGIL